MMLKRKIWINLNGLLMSMIWPKWHTRKIDILRANKFVLAR